jgi:hypothetical protein
MKKILLLGINLIQSVDRYVYILDSPINITQMSFKFKILSHEWLISIAD